MNTNKKRAELKAFCEHRGLSDQCEGCMLNFREYSCAFNTASDEEIERMYERFWKNKGVSKDEK